jgi:hypothetical protein
MEWRERVGIEPTGAAGGASVAVLKTGQTTRPDPLPPIDWRLELSSWGATPES